MSNIPPQLPSTNFTSVELSQIGNGADYASHVRRENVSGVAQESPKRWRVIRKNTSTQQSNTRDVPRATMHHLPILVPRSVMGRYAPDAPLSKPEADVLGDYDYLDSNAMTDDVYPDSPLLSEVETLNIGASSTMTNNVISNQQFTSSHSSYDAAPSYATSYEIYMQNQYQIDIEFQKVLTAQLGQMDDDTKAVAKFQIQKILVEARYGHSYGQRAPNHSMPGSSQE